MLQSSPHFKTSTAAVVSGHSLATPPSLTFLFPRAVLDSEFSEASSTVRRPASAKKVAPEDRFRSDVDEFAAFGARKLSGDQQPQQDIVASENDDPPSSPANRCRLASPLVSVKDEEPVSLQSFVWSRCPTAGLCSLRPRLSLIVAETQSLTAMQRCQRTSPTSTRPKSTSSPLQLSFSPRRKNLAARPSPTFPNGPTRKRRAARIPPSRMPCTGSRTATWSRPSNGTRKVGSFKTSRLKRCVVGLPLPVFGFGS